ncbi:MAG: urea ABC transporter permease subunit UrtB [Gammaproteobacteria bacterium]|nr:urea ABC transporter permease subunit UrtB [Gammaproteobacteria bacterium]
MLSKLTFILLLSSLLAGLSLADENSTNDSKLNFSDLVASLTTKKFDEKEVIIKNIQQSGHKRSLTILSKLLDGKLYYKKDDKLIVIANIQNKTASIINASSGEPLGDIAKKKLKKVGINNKLRRALNSSIAQLSLADSNPKVRKSAAVEMFKNMDDETSEILEQRLGVEKDKNVISALQTAIYINQLNAPVHEEKIIAIEALSDSLYPEVRVALKELEKNLSGNTQTLKSQSLLKSTRTSLTKIESRVGIYKQIENIFFGVSLGSVLLLIAVGLAITFGVMGVINMAHGEMLMLGAYTTYIIQLVLPNHIEYSILISIPTAFIFTGLVGIGIERGIIRFLYGRPLETLLATFGISLILQQAVRTLISPQNRAVSTPDWLSGSLEINPALSLTYNRLYIIIFALIVLAGLMLLLNKSRFGLQVRAVTQNRSMAKAMGIRTDWVDAFTFGLGSGIAGIAGVALSQLTNVGPNLGQTYIIDSFMVVVFGGVGNLWGTLFGAMTLGIANKYLEPFSGAVLAKIIVLVFIILFIQKRPRGMFALKGRSVDS